MLIWSCEYSLRVKLETSTCAILSCRIRPRRTIFGFQGRVDLPSDRTCSHRIDRVITNPPVTLKEPFNLNRENPEDYVRVPTTAKDSLVSNLPRALDVVPRRAQDSETPWERLSP